MYKYSDEAREVLEVLLEKYMNSGIKDVEDTSILKLPEFEKFKLPEFEKFGGMVYIIRKFGNKSKYVQAIRELENELFTVA